MNGLPQRTKDILEEMNQQFKKMKALRDAKRDDRRVEARRKKDEPVAVERRQQDRRSGIEDRRSIRYSVPHLNNIEEYE